MTNLFQTIIKITLLLAIILALFFTLGCTNENNSEQISIDQNLTHIKETNNTFTLSELQTHSNQNDCWIAVYGKVYDVTNCIKSHPGGMAIINGCGKDMTSLFDSTHSPRPRNEFYIGDLTE